MSPRLAEEMQDTEVKEVSGVDDPATARLFRLFKNRDARGVEGMGQRKDELPMSDEEAAMAVQEPPGAEIESEVVEIPAPPMEWTLSSCLGVAGELGLGEDAAIQACQRVRGDFGAPDDDDKIYVPEGMDPTALVAAAALSIGVAIPKGITPATYEFKGKSFWSGVMDRILRPRRPDTKAEADKALVKMLGALGKGVMTVMSEQTKSKTDLLAMAAADRDAGERRYTALLSVLAQHLGVTLPELAAAPAEPDPALSASGPVGAVVGDPPAKRACEKCGHVSAQKDEGPPVPGAAPAPGAPPADAVEGRIAKLEEVLAQLIGMLVPGADPTVPASAPTPPEKRATVPTLGPARFGTKSANGNGIRMSTITGLPMSREHSLPSAASLTGINRIARR